MSGQSTCAICPPDRVLMVSGRGYGHRALDRLLVRIFLQTHEKRTIVYAGRLAVDGQRIFPLDIGPFEQVYVQVAAISPHRGFAAWKLWRWPGWLLECFRMWRDAAPAITVRLDGLRASATPSAISA